MQSFRASPWVSYEPSLLTQDRDQRVSGSDMDEDIDMDAPHISTLKDEESPPPSSHKKMAASNKKRIQVTSTSAEAWGRGNADKEADVEDEEDQLIDELNEEENGDAKPSRTTDAAQKRKISAKRKARKGDRKVADLEKKSRDKGTPAGLPCVAPTISIFKANPTDSLDGMEMNTSPAPIAVASEVSVPKGKKKVPRKSLSVPRAKGKLLKSTSAVPYLLVEDAGVLSESYAGTAASSPITAPFDLNTPEPEILPPSSPVPSFMPIADEPPNLENVPIPVYPLPTKPFPVQPPPKIPTGFAPQMPLDKNGRKVRHWREANREIRGIAGGRWFARTWVGEKESDFATNLVAKSVDDKASSNSISTKATSHSSPATSKAISKLKASSKSASLTNSANQSRATSTAPDAAGHQVTSNVRAPTKMRISQQAPSEADGDSVSATPTGA